MKNIQKIKTTPKKSIAPLNQNNLKSEDNLKTEDSYKHSYSYSYS